MIEPSLIISAVSALIACGSLFFAISANRNSAQVKESEERVQLRITAMQLHAYIESCCRRYENQIEDVPKEVFEDIDLSPEAILSTLEKVDAELSSSNKIEKAELENLKVSLNKTMKEWECVEKEYLSDAQP